VVVPAAIPEKMDVVLITYNFTMATGTTPS